MYFIQKPILRRVPFVTEPLDTALFVLFQVRALHELSRIDADHLDHAVRNPEQLVENQCDGVPTVNVVSRIVVFFLGPVMDFERFLKGFLKDS